MTTASGSREFPYARQRVWWALTAVTPYCAVCDVSYVFTEGPADGKGTLEHGSRFLCVRGRLDGATPPPNAVQGRVVEWVPQERLGTTLEVTTDTWRTTIDLADAGEDSTLVTFTITYEPKNRSRLMGWLQRARWQRMVQRTVDGELSKLPEHVRGVVHEQPAAIELEPRADGAVLHLRGHVDASAVKRLELERQLDGAAVTMIDVAEVSYLDSTALPLLLRWAQRVGGADRQPIIRGSNDDIDATFAQMGLRSVFVRQD